MKKLLILVVCVVCFIFNISMVGVDVIEERNGYAVLSEKEMRVALSNTSHQAFTRGFRLPKIRVSKTPAPKPKAKPSKPQPKGKETEAPKAVTLIIKKKVIEKSMRMPMQEEQRNRRKLKKKRKKQKEKEIGLYGNSFSS
ncbi:MAG: hypothetical protein LVR00_00185 [Rhabdochlamydiaceae bacterium]